MWNVAFINKSILIIQEYGYIAIGRNDIPNTTISINEEHIEQVTQVHTWDATFLILSKCSLDKNLNLSFKREF